MWCRNHPGLPARHVAGLLLLVAVAGAADAQDEDSRPPQPLSGSGTPSQPPGYAAFRLGLLEPCDEGESQLDLAPVRFDAGPGLVFHGTGALLICSEDSGAIGASARQELEELFVEFLERYHFMMPAICAAEVMGIEGRALLAYELERAKLFQRISAVVSPPVARGFACDFGWTHYR